eukprot:240637_1
MGCCCGKNKETEEINLLDLESGVVDVAEDDGTWQRVEKWLHFFNAHRNAVTYGVVVVLYCITLLVFYRYQYVLPRSRAYWQKRVDKMEAKLNLVRDKKTLINVMKEEYELADELVQKALTTFGIPIKTWEKTLTTAVENAQAR